MIPFQIGRETDFLPAVFPLTGFFLLGGIVLDLKVSRVVHTLAPSRVKVGSLSSRAAGGRRKEHTKVVKA
jgi:hypothetical protein